MPGIPAGMMNVPGQTSQTYPGQMPAMAQQPTVSAFWIKCTLLNVNVFNMKVLTGDTSFVSSQRQDHHFMWSSEPCEGLSCLQDKESTFISQRF